MFWGVRPGLCRGVVPLKPHWLGIVGLENVTNRVEVIHVRIEPHIVLVRRHDDGHAIVQVGYERIRWWLRSCNFQ